MKRRIVQSASQAKKSMIKALNKLEEQGYLTWNDYWQGYSVTATMTNGTSVNFTPTSSGWFDIRILKKSWNSGDVYGSGYSSGTECYLYARQRFMFYLYEGPSSNTKQKEEYKGPKLVFMGDWVGCEKFARCLAQRGPETPEDAYEAAIEANEWYNEEPNRTIEDRIRGRIAGEKFGF